MALSVEIGLGGTAIVDALADTAPGVKVIVGWLIKVMLSVVLVAVMVLVSALVDLMVNVACPLELVSAEAGAIVLPVPDAAALTVLLVTELLLASRRVTVMVAVA